MTVRELRGMLHDIPDDAIVYVWADHGQTECKSYGIYVTDEHLKKMPLYDFEAQLSFDDMENIPKENITAISIFSE